MQEAKLVKAILPSKTNGNFNSKSDATKATQMSRGQTLIVVPTVALKQWQTEILRFTKEGSLTTTVYHGTSRGQLTQVSS